jgi:tRNA G18 (ribose-2'-O)-methylase SpoU
MPQIDRRNVADEFKNQPQAAIIAALDARGVELEIAIENTLRDFNMGSIVRSANAFGVRHVHVVGRRQWNKRGAMMTDTYLHLHYHVSIADFSEAMARAGRILYAVDNTPGAQPLAAVNLPKNLVLVFGQEGPGISPRFVEACRKTVVIEQLGSTRSLNVGVAAGIVMYAWLRQHGL